MPSSRIATTLPALLVLIAAGCGGGDTGRIDEEEAGVGPDAGFDVLIDTAATPAGGVPGMGTGGGTDAAGTATLPDTAAGVPGAAGADTAAAPIR